MKVLPELKETLLGIAAIGKANLSGWYVLLGLFVLSVLFAGCTDEAVDPSMSVEATKQVVTGRWGIEKVDYGLCRNSVCNTTYYTGSTTDYFEFSADSAILVKENMTTYVTTVERFKAEYTLPGVFVLSNNAWSGRFEVVESKFKKLVLKCSFTGRDPNAVFTDTYYLYK